jgi:Spy/CpxP family protein refolding chaperone
MSNNKIGGHTKMKKLTIVALILACGIIGLQQLAKADTGWGGGWGCGGSGYGYNRQAPDRDTQKAWEKFYNDTAQLREQLFAKRSEYNEAMSQDVIDKDLAAKLWGEIFDLQNQIREKATAAGLRPGFGRNGGYPCYGPDDEDSPSATPSASGYRL